MIDERINNNTGIENEEQEIDLVALLFKYLFYWRWFVASILICCIATYLFLRYQTPVYNISCSVLIKVRISEAVRATIRWRPFKTWECFP